MCSNMFFLPISSRLSYIIMVDLVVVHSFFFSRYFSKHLYKGLVRKNTGDDDKLTFENAFFPFLPCSCAQFTINLSSPGFELPICQILNVPAFPFPSFFFLVLFCFPTKFQGSPRLQPFPLIPLSLPSK